MRPGPRRSNGREVEVCVGEGTDGDIDRPDLPHTTLTLSFSSFYLSHLLHCRERKLARPPVFHPLVYTLSAR